MAWVHKSAFATDANGTRLDDRPAMLALYLLVKEDGRWWIASCANTLVQP